MLFDMFIKLLDMQQTTINVYYFIFNKDFLLSLLLNKSHCWYHGLSEAWWQGLNTVKNIGRDIANPRKK